MNTFVGIADWTQGHSLSQCLDNYYKRKKAISSNCQICTYGQFGYVHTPQSFAVNLVESSNDNILNYYSIVGDIRLYNREELAGMLGMSKQDLSSLSDSLLVLHAYRKWRYNCPSKLIGDFAFALWDRKEEELFVVRDHVGIRSFYYVIVEDEKIVFSDSISEILSLSSGSYSLNPDYIKDYLLEKQSDNEATVFKEIKTLIHGYFLLIRKDSRKSVNYWNLNTFADNELCGNRKYSEELSGILSDAVHCRVKGGGTVGILLSGGLDSSAVACLSANFYREGGLNPESLMAVSRVFKGKYKDTSRDEREYAEAIVNFTGMSATYCHEEIESPLDCLFDYYHKKATFPPNPFFNIVRPVSKAVAQMGVEKLLTGFGGDEAISMSGKFVYPILFRNMHFIIGCRLLRQYGRIYNESFLQAIRSKAISPLLPLPILKCYRFIRYYQSRELNNISLLSTELAESAAVGYLEKVREESNLPLNIYDRTYPILFDNFFQQYFEVYRYISDRYGYTTCHPLLDKRILEFCMKVPLGELIQDGWKRSLFRRALKGVLPEKVRLRKGKSAFSTSYVGYIQSGNSFIQKVLDQRNSIAWDFVNRDQVQRMNNSYFEYPKQVLTYEATALKMAKAVNVAAFIQWFESHVP